MSALQKRERAKAKTKEKSGLKNTMRITSSVKSTKSERCVDHLCRPNARVCVVGTGPVKGEMEILVCFGGGHVLEAERRREKEVRSASSTTRKS